MLKNYEIPVKERRATIDEYRYFQHGRYATHLYGSRSIRQNSPTERTLTIGACFVILSLSHLEVLRILHSTQDIERPFLWVSGV